MNWLSPFLTPAAFIEFGIVACVFFYLLVRFRIQNRQLKTLATNLAAESDALQGAQTTIAQARAAGEGTAARVARLNGVLIKDSMVWKRAHLTSRNRSRRPEATLPRYFYGITEEARYWQGAFVFIGLAGTLICLGLAVAYLTVLVARNPSDSASTSGLKDVVSHMTAVFGGMGAAFLSTASGVGFTLALAGKINAQERGWEGLREDVEEFSLLEIEPLSAQMLEKTEELPRLEAAVARMETIAKDFKTGLQGAMGALKSTGESALELHEANQIVAKTLALSAETLDGATASFAGASGELAGGLDSLQKTIGAHGETLGGATREWNEAGRGSLDALKSATDNATLTFAELSQLRVELLEQASNANAVIRESTAATHGLAREMKDSALALGGEMRVTNQSSLSALREEIARALLGVSNSIDGGVQSERVLLQQFGAIMESMGEYAMRVEETIAQLPAALGNEPLLVVENNDDATVARLEALRREVVTLRETIARDLPGAVGHSVGQSLNGLGNVGKTVEILRDEARSANAAARDGQSDLQTNVATLTSQVNGLSSQVAQMRASTHKLDKSIVISWPWGRS